MSDADLAFLGAARQAELVRSGEVSSRALVELYLDRIARHDRRLNAYRVVLPEQALAEADEADARRARGDTGADRPLDGVPIAVKDDMDLEGQVTAKGSIAHGNRPARTDATVVRRLRDAGAIVLGKTNVPELMTMGFTETVWYGATRNPWDPDRTPGGSSGGSAAAVAAGLCAAATGSDGAGSIRIPAACCGLVGLKAQPGRVPTPPSWRGLNAYGFLARTVADAALLHDVVADPGQPSFAEASRDRPQRLRLAVSTKVPLGVRARVEAVQRRAIDSLSETARSLGHDVSEIDPDFGWATANVVARYLRGIAEDAASMAHPERLDRRSKGLARLGRRLPDAVVEQAQRRAASDRERVARVFERVDALVLPVLTRMPSRIGEYEGLGAVRSLDKAAGETPFPSLFNHTGLPALAVPVAAMEDGFPLGVQLVGPLDSEPRLLGLAAQLEEVVGWPGRRPPGLE